ncbi:Uncharacterised protein [Klebsiella pneumoniae]|nr:Uncharacterised protein [Klebsiella pneumoniae]
MGGFTLNVEGKLLLGFVADGSVIGKVQHFAVRVCLRKLHQRGGFAGTGKRVDHKLIALPCDDGVLFWCGFPGHWVLRERQLKLSHCQPGKLAATKNQISIFRNKKRSGR